MKPRFVIDSGRDYSAKKFDSLIEAMKAAPPKHRAYRPDQKPAVERLLRSMHQPKGSA